MKLITAIKGVLVIFAVTYLLSNIAIAAVIDSVETTRDIVGGEARQFITIKGKSTKIGLVNIEVLNPLKVVSDFPTQGVGVVFNQIKQISTNDDGSYTYNYRMVGDTGQYCIRVHADTVEEKIINFISDIEIVQLLSDMNKSTNTNEVKAVVQKNIIVFREGIEDITITDNDNVYNQMYCNIPFANVQATINLYRRLAVIDKMNQLTNQDDIVAIFTKYNDLLDITNAKSYLTYTKFENNKIKVQKDLLGKSIKSFDAFVDMFNERVILRAIESVVSSGDVMPILESNANILNLNFAKYNTLIDKSQPLKALRGKLFSSIEDMKNEFYKVVDSQYEKENPPRNNGGSGGSSKGQVAYSKDKSEVVSPIETAKPLETNFSDLDGFLWAKESIESLTKIGAINGYDDKTFRPTKIISREQFIKIVVLAFGLLDENSDSEFNDVNKSDWFYKYVSSAKKYNLVNGIDNKNFGVGHMINREEIVTILVRTAEHLGNTFPKACDKIIFADEKDMSNFSIGKIYVLQTAGIINGTGSGKFMPLENCTRAEAAKMIFGVLSISGGEIS